MGYPQMCHSDFLKRELAPAHGGWFLADSNTVQYAAFDPTQTVIGETRSVGNMVTAGYFSSPYNSTNNGMVVNHYSTPQTFLDNMNHTSYDFSNGSTHNMMINSHYYPPQSYPNNVINGSFHPMPYSSVSQMMNSDYHSSSNIFDGRLTHTNYNHVQDSSTGTLVFNDYSSTDSATSDRFDTGYSSTPDSSMGLFDTNNYTSPNSSNGDVMITTHRAVPNGIQSTHDVANTMVNHASYESDHHLSNADIAYDGFTDPALGQLDEKVLDPVADEAEFTLMLTARLNSFIKSIGGNVNPE